MTLLVPFALGLAQFFAELVTNLETHPLGAVLSLLFLWALKEVILAMKAPPKAPRR